MNQITLKMQSLTTVKQGQFKFIVNCFFENNKNDNEQDESFNILNATLNARIGNQSQSDVIDSGQELSTVLNETIVTNISTAPLLTEDITINNTEQYSPTNENNNLDITTNNMQVLGQTNNTTLATITTLEEVTKNNKQRVNRPRQTKTKFTPYNITITLRNRNTCTIPVTTFFSSASQPRIGRGLNLTKIAKIRTDEQLVSDEIDLYIDHLNNKHKLAKITDVIILNVDFYIMALRYVVQEDDEFNAPQFQQPTGTEEFGELIPKYPLMKPYDEENEIRCTTVIGHFPKKEDFKNFQKVRL
jgi:hypothetical protein